MSQVANSITPGICHAGAVTRSLFRRWSDALMLTLAVAAGMAPQPSAGAYAVQEVAEIRRAVGEFLRAANGMLSSPDHVEVGVIDPRLRLARCGEPLKMFYSPGGARSGNTTVGVRCLGPSPWLIYVPARVKLYRDVVVTTRAVPRNVLLGNQHIRLEQRDVSGLTAGYLESPSKALGRVARRPLAIGMIIDPSALENRRLVRRGERVTILANAGRLAVQMKGKALMDGASGDRVRVKNLSSGRIVEGTVSAAGVIYVNH